MNKNTEPKTAKTPNIIRLPESPLEKAVRLSSEEVLARAIRDMINRDELN